MFFSGVPQKAPRVQGDDQLAMVRRRLAAPVVSQRLGTGQVTNQRPGNQLHHRRQRRTLVPAERQHRTAVEHHVGVGARLALGVDAPTFGNRLAGTPVQFDITPGNRAGGEVEHKRILPRTRPTEGNGIGAEHRQSSSSRRHPGVARITRQCHQTGSRQLLDLHPQRREMYTAVDCQRRNAVGPGFLRQQRQPRLKRQLRKPTAGIHPHNRWRLVDHLWLGIG
ncbi:hypothetical protein D3C76_1043210 [compost metagenome]